MTRFGEAEITRIWQGSASNPQRVQPIPERGARKVFYGIRATRKGKVYLGVFIDQEEADLCHMDIDKIGKEVPHWFSYPAVNRTVGMHDLEIRTGKELESGAIEWLHSKSFSIEVVPSSDD